MKGLNARRNVEGILIELQCRTHEGGGVYVCYVREIVEARKGEGGIKE
jgi:hypothetical protein